MKELSVVIPTYNEEENIKELLEELICELKDYDYEIIVVDDSDDSTASIVKDIQEENKRIRIIERGKKLGLGSACKEGFSASKGSKIVQMDADFSHRPSQIERLVNALEKHDATVGSRYIEGGKRRDSIWRRFKPLIGSYIYRYLLKSPISDVTSGFKSYNRQTLDKLPAGLPEGFHFQAASLMALLDSDADIKEVPIDFHPRRAGKPKYSNKDLMDNIKLMLKLFKEKRIEK